MRFRHLLTRSTTRSGICNRFRLWPVPRERCLAATAPAELSCSFPVAQVTNGKAPLRWVMAIMIGSRRPLPSMRPSQRSEEHTSELQSLMRTSYAVFCLKKKNTRNASSTRLPQLTHTKQHLHNDDWTANN